MTDNLAEMPFAWELSACTFECCTTFDVIVVQIYKLFAKSP
jgi:hypothetical protein